MTLAGLLADPGSGHAGFTPLAGEPFATGKRPLSHRSSPDLAVVSRATGARKWPPVAPGAVLSSSPAPATHDGASGRRFEFVQVSQHHPPAAARRRGPVGRVCPSMGKPRSWEAGWGAARSAAAAFAAISAIPGGSKGRVRSSGRCSKPTHSEPDRGDDHRASDRERRRRAGWLGRLRSHSIKLPPLVQHFQVTMRRALDARKPAHANSLSPTHGGGQHPPPFWLGRGTSTEPSRLESWEAAGWSPHASAVSPNRADIDATTIKLVFHLR